MQVTDYKRAPLFPRQTFAVSGMSQAFAASSASQSSFSQSSFHPSASGLSSPSATGPPSRSEAFCSLTGWYVCPPGSNPHMAVCFATTQTSNKATAPIMIFATSGVIKEGKGLGMLENGLLLSFGGGSAG
ncbi:unnamed protein product [Chondrus crispus]|uniref:Uncharacterized protein n=1 Tax=Chondrus crispus TaxID=2769 RepID=R7Q3N5_CHOCR|nr:unnamed protein product [Chondrus crispus]CDF33142.1 unnamed protein product [Chondrus crispus]|eukprot:XP_005712945.1 unnamed protein product [Chondrus crispus]